MRRTADRVATAERAARAGASVANEFFRTGIDVETKAGKTDVVTQADRDAQDRVIDVIREMFPGEPVVGEEGDELKSVPESGPAWIVDPIDGTANYVRGIQTWGTSVATVLDGETIAAANVFPALDDVYVADERETRLNDDPVRVSTRRDPETFTVVPTTWWPRDRRAEYGAAFRGIVETFGDARRYGCSQASLSMVASGQVEGVISNQRTNPWDTVAGVHMIRLAGGRVTNLEGERWRPTDSGLVASNDRAHETVLAAAREVAQRSTGD
ncbi:Archaeal fructose-1,6-bisphosphatase or related enzyme of inositol monophosphatase family [Halanaeroarchaeum sp. HSR-CO]|uniref:inositol monophosphatase family protein n=1 Tax=Halanaeroarchaeum sp. HSR-CO TaxID=2866382 RepID=UPI00217E7877|nr:inositol monophosphatase [Halanaeroarchaeum sp. HSR-CO]UWG48431.1 Archaeal fructose-1,6-bisphosphatase or related enzyme of inositol monophosphatase family [Halanaeroarchaeum sp. HSR-CO]